MNSGLTSVTLTLLLVASLHADQRCVTCHPKEVAAYAATGMARSLTPINAAVVQPDATFEHAFSKSQFVIHSMTQSLTRKDESAEQKPAFAIGSGEHAFQYLIQTGDHIFQSPLAYYTQKKQWDMAAGFESDPFPDFSRPVTSECLFCHSAKPLPIADTLNRYQPQVVSATGISCERCHGDASVHLKSPTPGSILNPTKLTGAARASVCEQCHLTGDARIPNPGKSITDFRPGLALEDFYTTYVSTPKNHAEQLALSKCAIKSGDQLWCGTCHNPHDKPVNTVTYYRDRCLTCHAVKLDKAHAAPDRDCISCHMSKLSPKEGSHSPYLNHQIVRNAATETAPTQATTITAWREPDAYVKDRNLALALVTVGLQNQSSPEVIQGYKMLNHLAKDFPYDASLYTTLGSILLKAKETEEALKCFRHAVALKPNYAPYYVNVAAAMVQSNHPDAAITFLEKARSLDRLLRQPVQMLHQLYHDQGDEEKSKAVLAAYDQAMNSTHH